MAGRTVGIVLTGANVDARLFAPIVGGGSAFGARRSALDV
jgi:hypothetical protein